MSNKIKSKFKGFKFSVSGFNLIELMVVLTILAGVTAASVIKYKDYSTRAGVSNVTNYAETIKAKIMLYYADQEDFPPASQAADLQTIDVNNKKYIANIVYVKGLTGLPTNVTNNIGDTSNVLGFVELDFDPSFLPSSTTTTTTTTTTTLPDSAKIYFVATLNSDQEVQWNQFSVGMQQQYSPKGYAQVCPGNQVASGSSSVCDCNYDGSTYKSSSDCLQKPINSVLNPTKTGYSCNPGFFGYDCSPCVLPAGAASCDPTTGNVASCNAGYGMVSGSCTACAAGYYSTAVTTAPCIQCAANQYSAGGADTCHNCPTGCTTCSSSTSCSGCTAGGGTSGYGLSGTSCTQCSSNQFSTGTDACQKCPNGCVSCSHSGSCNKCITGSGTSGYGLSGGSCTQCSSNQYSTTGTDGCQTCPNGCTTCSSATSCSGCTAGGGTSGYGLSGTSCTQCSSNQYSTGTSGCQTCQNGCTTCSSANSCSTCTAGSGTSGYGISGTSCTQCAANQYSTGTGGCQTCPTGCTACSSANSCSGCKAGGGTSSYGVSGTSCTQCAANQYSTGTGGCQTCPGNCATCLYYAGSAHCMTCSANYILTTFGNCVTCGANSCFSGDVCIDCDPGYYSAGGTCSSCSQCPTGCSACTSATQCTTCTNSSNYFNGTACVSCVAGSSLASGGQSCITTIANALWNSNNTITCTNGASFNGSACVAGSGCTTTASTPGASCFWMQNYGSFAWVPAYSDYSGCQALDSCDGGGGQSGGGCYKWSVGSDGCRNPWGYTITSVTTCSNSTDYFNGSACVSCVAGSSQASGGQSCITTIANAQWNSNNTITCTNGTSFNGSACVATSGCATTASTPGASCFWMQNYGAMAWVPSYTDYNGCRALDGCDGGGNQSGGGCYKWSVGSNGCRSSW